MVMGVCLTLIVGLAGFCRVVAFDTTLTEAFAITASLLVIVMTSIIIGATLPLVMNYIRIDPAHSSTMIQGTSFGSLLVCPIAFLNALTMLLHPYTCSVLMDIIGVTLTVYVGGAILESDIGKK
jgi:hypothetical protein